MYVCTSCATFESMLFGFGQSNKSPGFAFASFPSRPTSEALCPAWLMFLSYRIIITHHHYPLSSLILIIDRFWAMPHSISLFGFFMYDEDPVVRLIALATIILSWVHSTDPLLHRRRAGLAWWFETPPCGSAATVSCSLLSCFLQLLILQPHARRLKTLRTTGVRHHQRPF